MENIHLRTARPTEVPAIHSLILQAVDATASEIGEEQARRWRNRFEERELRDLLEQDGVMSLVAEDENGPLAVGVRKGAVIVHLFVHPASWGCGIATTLLERLESGATPEGADALTVDASPNAVRFYQKHGYRQTGSTECDPLCTKMEKRIHRT